MISILGQPLWPWKLFTHSSVLIICRGRRCDGRAYIADQGCSTRCARQHHLLPHQSPSIQTSIYTGRTQESSTPNFISNSRVQFSRLWTPLPSNPSVHPTSNFEVGSFVDDSPKLDSPPKLNSFLVRLTRHFSHSSNTPWSPTPYAPRCYSFLKGPWGHLLLSMMPMEPSGAFCLCVISKNIML